MLRFSKRQVFEALEAGFPVATIKVSQPEKFKTKSKRMVSQ
jgi:hypothetical protein